MKKIKFILPIAIMFQIMHSGCGKQKLNKYVTYEGHVYYKSGAPAVNVSVVLDACAGGSADKQHICTGNKFTIKKTETDQNGYFYIHEKAARTGFYFITIDNKYGGQEGVTEAELTEDRLTDIHLWY